MTTHSAQLQKLQELIITLFNDPFSLADLSDPEYQERVWLRAEGPEVDSLEDALDYFYEGFHFYECYDRILGKSLAAEYLHEHNVNLLTKLNDALRIYESKIDSYRICSGTCIGRNYPCGCSCDILLSKEDQQKILDDSQWHAIQSMAKDLYDNLSRLELMGMHIDSEHECFKEILDNVVGQKVASIELGHGSFLTIDLGKLVSKATKQKNREFRNVGEWHFWVYMCAWRIDKDNKPLAASSDPREKIATKIQEIAGTTLTKYEILNASLDTKFYFDDSITLTLFNISTDDEEQWMLFTPDKKVLVIGPADTWTYRLSSLNKLNRS
jgi:hypothetical protein